MILAAEHLARVGFEFLARGAREGAPGPDLETTETHDARANF